MPGKQPRHGPILFEVLMNVDGYESGGNAMHSIDGSVGHCVRGLHSGDILQCARTIYGMMFGVLKAAALG